MFLFKLYSGLITAFLQTSNNPVVIMVRPDKVIIQELKVATITGPPTSAAAPASNSSAAGSGNAGGSGGSGPVTKSSKIIDIVAIRHAVAPSPSVGDNGGEGPDGGQLLRTTLILLCEDGSLKIYMASPEHTEFWMSGRLSPMAAAAASGIAQIKPPRRGRRQAAKMPRPERGAAGGSGFPVDFFEFCSPITDVEYGGNDVLQVN